jgi:hypothetical protein
MNVSLVVKKKERILIFGAIFGAAIGIWFWWALQMDWLLGIPLVGIAAVVVCAWFSLQVKPPPQRRTTTFFVAASWICLVLPFLVMGVFILATPKDLPPPDAREAASIRAFQFVYPQALAVFFGLISLWGVRGWRPLGVIVRSGIGIGLACFFAYSFAEVAVGMNLWH